VQFHSGQIVSVSGIYRVEHNPAHATNAFSEITLIRSRRFPTCPYCDVVKFELVYADERRLRQHIPHRNHYRPAPFEPARPTAIILDRPRFMEKKTVRRIRFGLAVFASWLATFVP
jgi:hypothetical protein